MSRIVAQFDPSAGSGDFSAGAVNPCSTLWIMNESTNFIKLDFGGASTPKIVQPWYNKKLTLPNPVQTVYWTVSGTLQSGGAPASTVIVELYDPKEDVSDLISGPLSRQLNVGNAAAVASATSSVQNDGNAAGTTVVEATPSGAGSSQLLWRNDGSGIFGGGLATVSNAGIFTLPASAVPVASIGSGTLPSGVSVPAAQVGSGYPASSLSGAVPNATNATTANQLATGAADFTTPDDGATVHLRINGPASPRLIRLEGWNGSTQLANFDLLSDGTVKSNYAHLFADGGSLSGINKLSGSGSATVNHGLSATPDAAVVNTANGSNSTTFGSGSYTSSTVYIYQFNPQSWVGIAYKA